MRRLILLVFAACTSAPAPDASPADATPVLPEPARPDPIVEGVPHGGQIEQVAVTEQGDAAITFDSIGGVRLWPALDGTREPVPVSVIAPHQLALTHADHDLLAAVLDDAGSVRLVRLGRDGSVRGDVQLPADVPYEQVTVLGDGVLVRAADQTIEWLAADGTSRGKLAAEPGTRIETIAARRGGAIAVTTDGTKQALRWLHTLTGELSWGARAALPTAIQNHAIALSPSHRRIAVIDASSKLAVYDLGIVPVRVGDTFFASGADRSLGFVDDDHVAVMSSAIMQWWAMPAARPADPWAVSGPSLVVPSRGQTSDAGAVADGLAVTGFGAALGLSDTEHVHYLGYKQHGTGNLGAATSSLWMTMSGASLVWLDDSLAVVRALELSHDPVGIWTYLRPAGERHVIKQVSGHGAYQLSLVDVDQPEHPVALGTYPSVDAVEMAPEAGLLAIAVGSDIHRFAIDLATNAVHELPALKVHGSVSSLRLFDPERTDGITAITVGWDRERDENYTMTVFRADGAPQHLKRFTGRLIEIDETGTVYIAVAGGIEIRRGVEKIATVAIDGLSSTVAVAPGGSRFATLRGNEVLVVDAAGVEQWRATLWGAAQLAFTPDGTHLAARAIGGVVMFDAASGERTAVECGWSFGLLDAPPVTNPIAMTSVCEDPML